MKWFEDYTDDKSPKPETYQFFMYHGRTFHINLAMMYGFDAGEATPQKLGPKLGQSLRIQISTVSLILKKRLCHCKIGFFVSPNGIYTPDANFSNYVDDETTFDHEGSNFACDPHFV